jgi:hypothetical protein
VNPWLVGGIAAGAVAAIAVAVILGVVINNANKPECGTLGCVMVMNPPMP